MCYTSPSNVQRIKGAELTRAMVEMGSDSASFKVVYRTIDLSSSLKCFRRLSSSTLTQVSETTTVTHCSYVW